MVFCYQSASKIWPDEWNGGIDLLREVVSLEGTFCSNLLDLCAS